MEERERKRGWEWDRGVGRRGEGGGWQNVGVRASAARGGAHAATWRIRSGKGSYKAVAEKRAE